MAQKRELSVQRNPFLQNMDLIFCFFDEKVFVGPWKRSKLYSEVADGWYTVGERHIE